MASDSSLTLYVGNKNYSSWSMRAGVLLAHSQLAYTEKVLRFDSFAPGSQFKQALKNLSPTGRVPALVDDAQTLPNGQPLIVWDSLAIAEYVAELAHAQGLPALWPQDPAARAMARSVCAEMHSGFASLRGAFPMNIEASLPQVGALTLRDKPAVVANLQRLVAIWQQCLGAYAQQHKHGMLFGAFGVADAYFAPVIMRVETYALPVPPDVAAYIKRLCAMPAVAAWVNAALAEKDFIDFEEPHRLKAD